MTPLNEICEPEFDYAALDPDIASEAKAAAGHIRNLLRQTTAGIIEAGKQLKTVKDRLPHGQFTAWLAAEFGMSDRAARNYMVAAEWAAGKTATVSVLQPTTVYALGAPSTPETVKVGVLKRLESGEAVSDREVKSLIIQAKAERKAAKEERRQANEAGRREADKARLNARQKRTRAQREAEKQAKIAALEKARADRDEVTRNVVEILSDRLGEDRNRFIELMGKTSWWEVSRLAGWSR